MGKSSVEEISILVDKKAPVITLERLVYNGVAGAGTLSATYKVSDDNSFEEIKYCISPTNSCEGITPITVVLDVNGRFNVDATFIGDVTYKNFHIVILKIKDSSNNEMEENHVDTGLNLVDTIEEEIRLGGKDNCVSIYGCKSSYELDLKYTILDIQNLPEGITRSAITGSSLVTLYSSNVNFNNPRFIAVVEYGVIRATYTIEFKNFKVNVDKFDVANLTITLKEGTEIEAVTYEDENDVIEDITQVNENLTACRANNACEIEYEVKEKSGWIYKVVKRLELASVVNPTISGYGLSEDVIEINGKEYRVIYTDKDYEGEYTLTFDHGENENIVIPELTSIELHREYEFTYGYYDESKVLNEVTYRF